MRGTEALQEDRIAAGAGAGSDPTERRSNKRKPVLWAARLESKDGSAPCIILDLSMGGAKLRGISPSRVRQPITLVIDRFGSLHGEVVWARMGLLGMSFSDAPAHIAKILGETLPL
jgi:hypothetical protein